MHSNYSTYALIRDNSLRYTIIYHLHSMQRRTLVVSGVARKPPSVRKAGVAYARETTCYAETRPPRYGKRAWHMRARNHVLRCQIIIILASTRVQFLSPRIISKGVCACAIARGGVASVLRMRCADRKPRRYNPGYYAPAIPPLT